jgi:hypothetical protein
MARFGDSNGAVVAMHARWDAGARPIHRAKLRDATHVDSATDSPVVAGIDRRNAMLERLRRYYLAKAATREASQYATKMQRSA